jgi:proteic killer suppression protein
MGRTCAVDCNEIGDTKVDVRYGDKKLEKLCTDEREMRKKRGDIAEKLRKRINALKTASSVGELPTHDPLGKWHPLAADLSGEWAGKLSGNYRLLIRPDGAEDPRDAATVTVVDITDYH